MPDERAASQVEGGDEATGFAIERILLRNRFYVDGYRTLTRILAATVALCIFLGVVAVVAVVFKKEPPAYGLTTDGRAIPLYPVDDKGGIPDSTVIAFTMKCMLGIHSLNFRHYEEQLQDLSSRCFTREGWSSYDKALHASGNLKALIAGRNTMSAGPVKAPLITADGILGGRYTWLVRTEILVTYEGGAMRNNQNIVSDVYVVRVPRFMNPAGIAIDRIISR